MIYGGELWAVSPDLLQVREILVPDGVWAMVIAELENEMANVVEVSVNGRTINRDCILVQGQSLRVPVSPRDLVSLKGYYLPDANVYRRSLDPWRKNRLIVQFINTIQYSPGGSAQESKPLQPLREAR